MSVRGLCAAAMFAATAAAVAGLWVPVGGAQAADPVLTIVEPESQTTLVGVVRMRAEIVPATRVEAVEFFVDGEPACTAAAARFECAWDAGSRPEARVVRAVARLAGGGRLVHSVRTAGAAAFFSARTSLVLVPVAVHDRRGRSVEGLTLDAFEVYEDGVRQELSFFESADVPLDLVLAVDFSSSMATSMAAVRFAARQFVGALPRSARLGLVAFNDRVFVAARQQQDPAVLARAIDSLPEPFGGTALLDAIVHALGLLGNSFAHRAVVLFSDGDDQDSLSAIEQVEQRIRASRATAYVVTLGRGRAIERVRTMLDRLTRVSGGRLFAIDRIDDLNDVLAYIAGNLRDRYCWPTGRRTPALTARGAASRCARAAGGTSSRRGKATWPNRRSEQPGRASANRHAPLCSEPGHQSDIRRWGIRRQRAYFGIGWTGGGDPQGLSCLRAAPTRRYAVLPHGKTKTGATPEARRRV